jgi:hypothetical protein
LGDAAVDVEVQDQQRDGAQAPGAKAPQVQADPATSSKKQARETSKSKISKLGLYPVDERGQRLPFSEPRELEEEDDGAQAPGALASGAPAPRFEKAEQRDKMLAARQAKPGLTLPLAEDDYVIVARGPDQPGELAIGLIRGVEETHVTVHWHDCPDASQATPKQAWWPLYRNSRGELRPSQLPPMRQKPEIYQVDRDRVQNTFPALTTETPLPDNVIQFLERMCRGVVKIRDPYDQVGDVLMPCQQQGVRTPNSCRASCFSSRRAGRPREGHFVSVTDCWWCGVVRQRRRARPA